MKISDLLAKLEGHESTKALAAELRADLGAALDQDTKALGAAVGESASLREQLKKSEGQIADLSAHVKKLGDEAKGAEGLKAKVEAFESEKREAKIGEAFAKAAKEHGLPESAHATARKLFDFSAVKIGEKGEVSGLTKEAFDGLKKDHPILLAKVETAAAPAAATQTIPALPPAGSGNAAAGQIPQIGGAVGKLMQSFQK